MRGIVVALPAVLLLAAAAPRPDPARQEKEKLQGTWVVLQLLEGGQSPPADVVEQIRLTFRGDKLLTRERREKQPEEQTYKLDPTRNPKRIEITPAAGPNKGQPFPGIYELEGDAMRICLARPGQQRPTQFLSPRGTDLILMVLKRAPR
ncbi:MAG TPA: TIGR03067 domain-containing protein [Gemmataceae bacterium]|nr:TIGR03067 domain-containing protein [Gemmataceae bacterium]